MKQPRQLLLVDDDALIRLLVTTMLGVSGGWVVTEAATLAEAEGLLAAALPPDVVVLDESLPDGSGLELVAAVRQLPGPVHVVLYSGAVPAAPPPGVDAVVQKGGAPDALLDHLASL